MKVSVKTWIWIAIAATFAGVFGYYLIIGPKIVPDAFAGARKDAEHLTDEILFLADGSLASLNKIGELDAREDYSNALILTSGELIKNKDIRDRAVALSVALGKMAQDLPRVSPRKAREAASEAIGYEVALVGRLISYNDYLNQLFELLRAKFSGIAGYTDGKVQSLINEINAGANAVNGFNGAFKETMRKFDAVYR